MGGTACVTSPSRLAPADVTPDVGRKFFADGRVHSFPGSTVICHVEQKGPNADYFSALLDIYREAPRYAFTRKLVMLPPSSYHMTVFDLVTDETRTQDRWPDGLPLDASIDACNRYLAERLRSFRLATAPRFSMQVAPYAPEARERTLALRLKPATEEEGRRLQDLRDRLSAYTGIRAPNHADYQFHTTLGYFLRWPTPAEVAEFRQALAEWQSRVAAAAPQIVLGPPEFCTFRDMLAFNRQFFLS